MIKRYGSTQVCEFRLTQAEVDELVLENVSERLDPSYDFDHPVLIKVKNDATNKLDYVVRFIQKAVAQDGAERHVNFKPISPPVASLPREKGE